jgi:hypothetical protein
MEATTIEAEVSRVEESEFPLAICMCCHSVTRRGSAEEYAAMRGQISHGICGPCATAELAKVGLELVRDEAGIAQVRRVA